MRDAKKERLLKRLERTARGRIISNLANVIRFQRRIRLAANAGTCTIAGERIYVKHIEPEDLENEIRLHTRSGFVIFAFWTGRILMADIRKIRVPKTRKQSLVVKIDESDAFGKHDLKFTGVMRGRRKRKRW